MNMFYNLGAVVLAEGGMGIAEVMKTTIGDMKSEYMVVLPVALGLSAVFWGSKMLWGKFKSVAK